MKGQHISVIIADRPYRLKISGENEEVVLRQAGELINSKIHEYATNFAFRDKQDLLAMVALHFATDVVKSSESAEIQASVSKKLADVEKMLDDYLNNNTVL